MIEPAADLLEEAQDHVDGSLRALASYEEQSYDIHYLRDDIEHQYSEGDIKRVFDYVALAGLSRDYLEQTFHAGSVLCTVYSFEDADMFHFQTDRTEGFFLSFDRNADVHLDSFINDCRAVLRHTEAG